MPAVGTPGSAGAVDGRAELAVYVEGGPDGFDQPVIQALLRDLAVEVRTLGCCDNIRAAAAGLHASHPNYLFVADRDHRDELTVEASWERFPDDEQSNLLFWRRHELENYFLDPDWLVNSQYRRRKLGRPTITNTLLAIACKRVYLDVANAVIAALHRETQECWITPLKDPACVPDAKAAWEALASLPNWSEWPKQTGRLITLDAIRQRFDRTLGEYLGGASTPTLGAGQWQNRMAGKELYHDLVQQCCTVRDLQGKQVQGAEAHKRVAVGLIQAGPDHWPDDLGGFHDLVRRHQEHFVAR